MSKTGYEHDFYAWLAEQTTHLRAAKEWQALDPRHLLKWTYQPERRGRSWQRSTLLTRQHLDRRLHDSPSLRPELSRSMAEAYTAARRLAAVETALPETTFLPTWPWSLEQLRDLDFLPEP